MNIKKDILIINNCPAFYKINLYNELATHKDIFVVFLGLSNQVVSGNHFKNKIKFPYILINDFQVEKRSFFKTLYVLIKILFIYQPNKIIYGGYIEKELLFLSFFINKRKNILQTETASETKLFGWRYWLKIVLLSRYSKAIASGKIHAEMLRKMKFSGKICISKGVGFIEKKQLRGLNRSFNNNLKFLFIGRLIKLKNLEILIEIFNELQYPLTIVGQGSLKEELKAKANSNINFLDFVNNEDIGMVYNSCDIFILPSLSEPWGLVVEEALYYGLPTMVSDRVGSYPELIEENKTGVTFNPENKESIKNAIHEITANFHFYKKNVDQFDFNKKDLEQLNSYLRL